jgi:hypothetical protein
VNVATCATPRRLQVSLYLRLRSVAGIVVFGVEFRFPEVPSIAMNRTSSEFLSGWKDIAKYLGKGVRTVQRYERRLRLPVRRPSGNAYGSVLATRAELDAWVSTRSIRNQFELPQAVPKASPSTFAALRKGLADTRRLQEEMLELRQELKASVESLHATLGFMCGVRRGVFAELNETTASKSVPPSFVPAWQVNAEKKWRPRRESNPQPSDPKSDALSS